MPYSSIKELPSQFSKLPANAKKIAMHTINSVLEKGGSEESAFKQAWGAIKKSYKKTEKGWSMKSYSFDSRKIEVNSDRKNYYFEGYLENFEEDKVKDICTRECLIDMANQLNDGMKGFSSFKKGDFDHDTTMENDPFKIPISKITESFVDTKGLFVKGMFNSDHPEFDRNVRMAENGFLDGLSITYNVMDFKERQGGGRILNKVRLNAYAHTPRPVCDKCRLTTVFAKSLNFDDGDEDFEDVEESNKNKGDIVSEKVETPVVEAKSEIKTEVKEAKVEVK